MLSHRSRDSATLLPRPPPRPIASAVCCAWLGVLAVGLTFTGFPASRLWDGLLGKAAVDSFGHWRVEAGDR